MDLGEDGDNHKKGPPRNDDEARMPPPQKVEIDWPSKMIGCQVSLLPETFSQSGFFTNTPRNNHHRNLSPSNSLEEMNAAMMDESSTAVSTTGRISYTGSVGGASLCQVFSQEDEKGGGIISGVGSFTRAGSTGGPMGGGESFRGGDSFRGGLSQMPSWERSFRSKSPSTICSDDGKSRIGSPPLSPAGSIGDLIMKEE